MGERNDREALGAKDPDERRRRIVAAAVEVIMERGYAGTRMNDIAQRAGTSAALIVYHFGSLDGVLGEAVKSVEDDFFVHFDEQVRPDADAVERLRLTGRLAMDMGPAGSEWVLWLEIWVRALRDESARELRAAMDRRFRDHVRRTIEAGVADGTFECSDPASSAVRLVALLDGLGVQGALGDPDVPEERMVELWLAAAASEVGLPASRFAR